MLLFDLGNVVLTYDQEATMKKLAEALNPLTALLIWAKKDEFMGEFKRDTDLLETGRMNMSQFFLRLQAKTGLKMEEAKFLEVWQSGYAYREDVLAKVAELAKNEPCAVVANLSREQEDILKARPDFACFAGWACSWKLEILREGPEFFKKAASSLGVPVSECLYIDDREDNVKWAMEAGMQGRVYAGLESLEGLRG